LFDKLGGFDLVEKAYKEQSASSIKLDLDDTILKEIADKLDVVSEKLDKIPEELQKIDVQPIVEVKPPEVKIPEIKIPEPKVIVKTEEKNIEIPKEIEVKGIDKQIKLLEEIKKQQEKVKIVSKDKEKTIAEVVLVDPNTGKPYKAEARAFASTQEQTRIPGLLIPAHDYIELTYTGEDLTQVVYKSGGASGTVVATLNLSYSGGKLVSITKT
jgi:hypothetical protein